MNWRQRKGDRRNGRQKGQAERGEAEDGETEGRREGERGRGRWRERTKTGRDSLTEKGRQREQAGGEKHSEPAVEVSGPPLWCGGDGREKERRA